MSNLRSYKKKQLIRLVNGYEADIEQLRYEIERMNLEKTLTVKEYIILDKEDDDRMLMYIKNRLKCVRGKNKMPYQLEMDRLMAIRQLV